MNPAVVAAIIAASASLLTLIGTLAAQYFGRRATSRDTEKSLRAQGDHLDRTLAEQRSQTLTEWFGTAVEQLGHERPGVRVAAVYALEQIAIAAPQLRAPIHELLSAYIRAESTWAHHDPATHVAVEAAPENATELPLLKIRAPDVQAAVTVLGRRCELPGEVIELQSVDLRAAYFGDANLQRVILGRSMLAGADLSRADLSDAWLRRVNLRDAILTGVILRRAVLRDSILNGANLTGADLTGADLQRATCDDTTVWPEGFDWHAAGVARET
jgi:Pentapeptide repeats (8 copies)